MTLNARSDTTALRHKAAATGTAAKERNKAACEALDAFPSTSTPTTPTPARQSIADWFADRLHTIPRDPANQPDVKSN
jgi:hypothetical protein